MISVAHLFEIDIDDIPVKTIKTALKSAAKGGSAKAALKQATVWGLSGAAASKLTQSKGKKTREERKKAIKDLAISTGAGAAAGAVGSLI